jgi:DNA helicase-2/ATP-dependent DNA helicase PcrA
MSNLLRQLNAEQQQAALSPEAQILLLAGAGSGKTRTLTARFLHWQQQGALPWQFLVLTFTNKAALELRLRLRQELGEDYPWSQLWLGTFHGLAYRLLRQHYQAAGLSADFPLLDGYGQRQLLKKILKEQKLLSEDAFQLGQVVQGIQTQKEAPEVTLDLYQDPRWQGVFAAYQAQCQSLGALDFSDLLLKSQNLLISGSLGNWPKRFRFVLVDEFQDTNPLQYRFLQAITQENIFVVGDDDQSIYGFRGAKPLLLKTFLQDFPQAKLYRLEENYRSTPEILAVANAVIAQAPDRLGKTLHSQQSAGEMPQLLAFRNSEEEAKSLVQLLQHWQQQGIAYQEMAVLYRQHRLSQSIENALLLHRLPYQLASETAFYQQRNIQLALAYLRLYLSTADNLSFQEVINTPARGLGEKTQEKIFHYAQANGLSAWDAGLALLKTTSLRKNLAASLRVFYEIFDNLPLNFQTFPKLLQRSGLFVSDEKTLHSQLLTLYQDFWQAALLDNTLSSDKDRLVAFLAHTALFSNENSQGQGITLASIHGVKGLEFTAVILVGVEEGQLPHYRAEADVDALAEERRLFYVAITRAKKYLVLTFSEQRQDFGQGGLSTPSRFLAGLESCLRFPTRWQQALAKTMASSFSKGRWVEHPQFGFGEVLDSRPPNQVLVAFSDKSRWLRLEFIKPR